MPLAAKPRRWKRDWALAQDLTLEFQDGRGVGFRV